MPGLAGEQHYLTFTGLCLGPSPQKQFEFFFPPDEGVRAGRVQRLEAACHRTHSQCRPDCTGPAIPLGPCSKVLKLKQIAEEAFACFLR